MTLNPQEDKNNNLDQKSEAIDTQIDIDQEPVVNRSFLRINKKSLLVGTLISLALIIIVSFFSTQVNNEPVGFDRTETQGSVLEELLSEDFKENSSIWVEAFSPWEEVVLSDFKLRVPYCNGFEGCHGFTSSETAEAAPLVDDCVKIGNGYFTSQYYEPVWEKAVSGGDNSNHIYLAGGLNICKITSLNSEMSAEEYIANYNSDTLDFCESKGAGWTLKREYSKPVSLENKNVSVVDFKPDSCYSEEGGPGSIPRYMVEFNKNLYVFHGGQEPLPSGAMNEIFESIEVNQSDQVYKNYINEEYGFSFDYPIAEGYQIFESDENNRDALVEISVAKPNTSSSSFRAFIYKSDLSAKDWWENIGFDIQNNLWSRKVVVENISSSIVAGRDAYYAEVSAYSEESGTSFKMSVVSKDGYIYLFEVHHKEISDYSDGEQILSSIKFLTSTINWKELKNSQLGFSLKYPQEWSFDGEKINLPEECYTETGGPICTSGYLSFSKKVKSKEQPLLDFLISEGVEEAKPYTTIAKLNAVIVNPPGMFSDIDIYIPKNDTEYIKIDTYQVGYEELDEILSTFSFVKD